MPNLPGNLNLTGIFRNLCGLARGASYGPHSAPLGSVPRAGEPRLASGAAVARSYSHPSPLSAFTPALPRLRCLSSLFTSGWLVAWWLFHHSRTMDSPVYTADPCLPRGQKRGRVRIPPRAAVHRDAMQSSSVGSCSCWLLCLGNRPGCHSRRRGCRP
jgi:hypothetical protein